MQSIRFNLPVRRVFRVLAALCVCVLLFVSSALPASAAHRSDPTEGEANLTQIEKKSQEAVLSKPYDLEKTQAEANKGINEVQGDADRDKMITPETANATSVKEQVERALEKLTNRD
ncbi:hypothetical protein [Kamptonema formosum]|uniref:hypothetical protein n=1 Tax=Kamptonema formosum TaxID=331992 RepID=UPI0004770F06|nr:hypothetical protein [Oscillatoria sp. PCC 10802]